MTFLATYWWVFLILTFVFSGASVLVALRSVQKTSNINFDMLKNLRPDAVESFGKTIREGTNSMFSGMIPSVLFAMLASFSGILCLIGVVVAVINRCA